MAVAIQLAMDDFRPPEMKPHKDASRMERCLYRRESYDVEATPGPEGIILVRFAVSHGACEEDGPAMDMGATYAIDVRSWRILAIRRP